MSLKVLHLKMASRFASCKINIFLAAETHAIAMGTEQGGPDEPYGPPDNREGWTTMHLAHPKIWLIIEIN